jgi:hypothetical protein
VDRILFIIPKDCHRLHRQRNLIEVGCRRKRGELVLDAPRRLWFPPQPTRPKEATVVETPSEVIAGKAADAVFAPTKIMFYVFRSKGNLIMKTFQTISKRAELWMALEIGLGVDPHRRQSSI